MIKELKDGKITTPLGFKANAVRSGIKNDRLDLCLIYSIIKANAAAVFTSNKVKAAHVRLDLKKLKGNQAQAIIVNSGNANCCTGTRGIKDALEITSRVADKLGIKNEHVLIASTGVIGKFLPIKKIMDSIPLLVSGLNFDKADDAAKSIMTTDKFPKQIAVEVVVGKKRVTIAAMAKGAGMICPDMATMLCFVTTDANITSDALKKALKGAVGDSFNCISVDGDMSTNDTVAILANGLAANALITQKSKTLNVFTAALKYVCLKLAKMIVEDGEGATKILQVHVKGAKTKTDAVKTAQRVANSPLIKTMIAGENPNWGRIPAAVGASGVNFEEEKMEISLQGKTVYRKAKPVLKDNRVLIPFLAGRQINIDVNLSMGKFEHTVWASDLTKEYVQINTEYN